MRMRNWALGLAAAVAVLLPARADAQPTPAEPTVEVRVRSVNDLLDKAEYVGGLFDQEEAVKQVRELVKQLSAEGKGVEGVDPKNPIGAYAVLTPDVADSPVVLMVPIADRDRFLQMLSERVGVEAEKGDDGVYSAFAPIVNEVYMRFESGYLYLARDPAHLDKKTLVNPKAFFQAEKEPVASLVVRIDRIPDELKTFAIGQLEHQIQEQVRENDDDQTDLEKKAEEILADAFVGTAKMVIEDGKAFALRGLVQPKTDELSFEVSLSAKSGSSLAKNLSGLAGRKSLPAGIVAAKNPTVHGGAKLELTEDLKGRVGPVIDKLITSVIADADGDEKEMVRRVLNTLKPTFKAGLLDAAASLSPRGADGEQTLLAAVAVEDGKEIEKLIKEVAKLAPADEVEFTFDVETVGKFTLHKIVGKDEDDDFARVFGTTTIWLATSDECIALSIEPDGKALKAGLKNGPAPAGLLTVEAAVAKAVNVFGQDLQPDERKALVRDAFGDDSPVGKDTIRFSVEGGDSLTAKFLINGKAFRLLAMLGEFTGDNDE